LRPGAIPRADIFEQAISCLIEIDAQTPAAVTAAGRLSAVEEDIS
jgi:hypothetical protein